jgi:hypothetical protein
VLTVIAPPDPATRGLGELFTVTCRSGPAETVADWVAVLFVALLSVEFATDEVNEMLEGDEGGTVPLTTKLG